MRADPEVAPEPYINRNDTASSALSFSTVHDPARIVSIKMDSQRQPHASERIATRPSSETAIKGLRAIREGQDYKALVDATIRSFLLDLGDDDSEDEQDQTAACEGLIMWPQLRQGMTKRQKQAASRLIAFDEISHLLTTALQQSSLQIRSQNWKDCRVGARSRKLLYDNMRDFFKMAPEEF